MHKHSVYILYTCMHSYRAMLLCEYCSYLMSLIMTLCGAMAVCSILH